MEEHFPYTACEEEIIDKKRQNVSRRHFNKSLYVVSRLSTSKTQQFNSIYVFLC